jgi:hypothetical protein
MAEIVRMINWKPKNQDYDFNQPATALLNQWVIEWLAVTTNSIGAWKCYIQVTRTTPKTDTFLLLFENTAPKTIDTSWTKKVWISINQSNVDNPALNLNESWEWIGQISIGASYPVSNYIPLASITSWVITDVRTFVSLKDPIVWATYELLVNKSTNTSLWISNTLYPTQNAVKTYVDWAIQNNTWVKIVDYNWWTSAEVNLAHWCPSTPKYIEVLATNDNYNKQTIWTYQTSWGIQKTLREWLGIIDGIQDWYVSYVNSSGVFYRLKINSVSSSNINFQQDWTITTFRAIFICHF